MAPDFSNVDPGQRLILHANGKRIARKILEKHSAIARDWESTQFALDKLWHLFKELSKNLWVFGQWTFIWWKGYEEVEIYVRMNILGLKNILFRAKIIFSIQLLLVIRKEKWIWLPEMASCWIQARIANQIIRKRLYVVSRTFKYTSA